MNLKLFILCCLEKWREKGKQKEDCETKSERHLKFGIKYTFLQKHIFNNYI